MAINKGLNSGHLIFPEASGPLQTARHSWLIQNKNKRCLKAFHVHFKCTILCFFIYKYARCSILVVSWCLVYPLGPTSDRKKAKVCGVRKDTLWIFKMLHKGWLKQMGAVRRAWIISLITLSWLCSVARALRNGVSLLNCRFTHY